MKENDGGRAFPVPAGFYMGGMSLRDWFAGQVLPVAISNCSPVECLYNETMEQMFARKAYTLADAMLAERVKS